MNFGKHGTLLASLAIMVAAFAVYANALRVPFVFDDNSAIVDNPTIRHLWPLGEVLSPPKNGSGVTARPLVNLSLALNYAADEFNPRGYHAANIGLHALAALVLYGLLRRTLARPVLPDWARKEAGPIAFAVALIWTLHPLQTESVVCIAQRTELLFSLFYLLTLFCWARGVDSPRPRLWFALSLAASLAGMASKESMVTAPFMVLLYDRTFLAGTFKDAWSRRWPWFLGLAATWILLACLVLSAGGRRGLSAGFGLDVSPFDYLLTQARAITLYLKLTVWPHPLVVDYGGMLVRSLRAVAPEFAFVAFLGLVTLVALRVRPVLGFAGAWFFGILAPSSSVVPLITQTIAEHRMYLPVAAPCALAVVGAFFLLGRRALFVCLPLALAAAVVTVQRNSVYQDEETLWRDTIAHCPESDRAHNNLGRCLYNQGDRFEEAIACYRESLRLNPMEPNTNYNLGLALMRTGRLAEAEASFEQAVRLRPWDADAQLNLGIVRTGLGRPADALAPLGAALGYEPSSAETHFRLGLALAKLGRTGEAIEHYKEATRLNPGHAEARSNWAVLLFQMGLAPEALEQLNAALSQKSDRPEVHFNLGLALASMGRLDEAIQHYTEAVRLAPDYADARLNLGISLGQTGNLPEAIGHLEHAVRLRPDSPEAHTNLALALDLAGRGSESLAHYETALRLRPSDAQAHYNVGFALLAAGRPADARGHFEEALKLQPDFSLAREMLRRLQEMPSP